MGNEITKSTGTIAEVLKGEKMLQAIAEVVPKHITAERMIKVGLMALNRTPKLANCTRDSFLQSMMTCSSLGLEPDGRLCHLIPYGQECTLIVDYKGLIELAKRSGEVAKWTPETVKENDSFEWRNGIINHVIDFTKDRGALQCVYSSVKLKNGETDVEVMTLEEVKAIKKRSKASSSGPWITDFEEMAKKTVIRRHSKRLTLSSEFQSALEKDGDEIQFKNARNVTPKREDLTTDVNPFAEKVEPLTLAELMERDKIDEADLLQLVSGAGICKVDIAGVDKLTADQVAHVVADWDAIMKGGQV